MAHSITGTVVDAAIMLRDGSYIATVLLSHLAEAAHPWDAIAHVRCGDGAAGLAAAETLLAGASVGQRCRVQASEMAIDMMTMLLHGDVSIEPITAMAAERPAP